MTAPPEPATSAKNLDPEAEVLVRPADVLTFVLQEAARRNPSQSHLYARMSASQVKDGVDVVLKLLTTHRELLDRQGRRARTGRRVHNQRVYRLLAATNTANITLTEAFLEAAYGLLPPSRPQHTD